MEPRTKGSDDFNHVKLDPALAGVKSEPLEDEIQRNLRSTQDCHGSALVKRESQEYTNSEVILPYWSYLNPETDSEEQQREESSDVRETVKVEYFNIESINAEHPSSDKEAPLDTFIEIKDFSTKEEPEEYLPVSLAIEERNEGNEVGREGIADVSEGRDNVYESGEMSSCEQSEFISIESKKTGEGNEFHYHINPCHIIDKNIQLGKSQEYKIIFQGQENDRILNRHEDTGIDPSNCVKCFRNLCSTQSYQGNNHLYSGLMQYKCDICGKGFLNSNRKNYTGIPKGQRLYTCQHCKKEFASKYSIKRHIQTVHLKEKQHECPHCGQRFGVRCDMKKHFETVHLKLKQFVCQYCGQRFGQISDMRKHIKIVHLKVKKCECQECGQRFGASSDLKIHIQTIHLKEKAFQCQYCGQKFSKNCNMKKHIKTVHLKIRQYECQYCRQKFSQISNMKSHIQTVHLKVKQYECQQCGQWFGQSSYRKKHLETVHLKKKEFQC